MSYFGFLKRNEAKHVNQKNRGEMTLVVRANRCPQNHPCPAVRVCPVKAIKQQGFGLPRVDMNLCIKCGKCINFCPTRALVLK